MALDLGQLVIELVGDYSQLKRDIEEAKRYALKQAIELEKSFKISPTFDAKSLLASAEISGLNTGKALGRGIEKSLNSYKFSNTSFKVAGEAIAQGLVSGMKAGDSQVKASASRMAGLVIDETKTKLKIHSPSKVFQEIGSEIVAGLAAGIGAGGALSISGLIQGIINDAKSVIAFAGDSINKYSDFKATEAQLTSLTGSTTKATETLKFLRAEADKLALPFLDSTKAYASLVAATNDTKLAPVTKDIFSGFSAGARAAQLSTADFNGAFLGLVQSITKGKQTTQDFRQISDRIPQAMSVAAKSIGVTNQEFKKLLESGDLTSTVFIPAFTKALGEASKTTLATATDTSTASLTRLNNRLDEVKVSLGKALEPGLLSGLGFIEQALNEIGKAGLFDDLNAGAKEFAAYLKTNPQLARELAQEFRSTVQAALKNVVGAARDLGDYLQKNPDAIHRSVEAVGGFINSLKDAVNVASELIKPFADIANFALQTEQRLSNAVKSVAKNSNSSPAKDIEDVSPFLRPVVKFSQLFGLNKEIGDRAFDYSKNPVVDPRLKIIDSNDLKPIHSYADVTRHHVNRGMESDRDYDTVATRLEEVRRTAYGNLVKKDFILQNAAGSQAVGVPSPVSGYVRNSADYGKSGIYSQKQGGVLLGQVLHLDPSSFRFKDGELAEYGEPLGTQAGTGAGGKRNAYGVHSHVEVAVSQFKKYIQDIQDGVFDGIVTDAKTASESVKKMPMQHTGKSLAQRLSLSASDGWMKTIASTYGAGDGFDGQPTASGRKFNQNELTAAINENLKRNLGVKWGDKVEAINPANGKAVTVTITDHGPYERGANGKYVPHSTRGLDLSTAAAKQIGISLGEVAFRVLGKGTNQAQAIAKAQAQATTATTSTTGQQPPEIRAILEGEKLKDAQARRVKLREAAAQTQNSMRSLQDLDYSTIKSPSLLDRQAEEARKQQQRFDEEIKAASQRREDAQSRIGINSARLSSGSVPDAEAKDLQLQIALDKRSVTELDGVIQRLAISRANAAKQLAVFQSEQRNIRARSVDFDSRAVDNSILADRISGLKGLESLNPTDARLGSLPGLERELALKTTQLELDRRLAAVTDAENKRDITPTEANARVVQLQKENDLLVANINIQYAAATAARTLAKAKLELNSLVRDNSSKSEFLRQNSQLSEYGFGGNKFALNRDANGLDLQSKYAQDKVSLLERARLEGLTPEQTSGEKLRLALRFNQANLLNNAQFKRASDDEGFSNSQSLGRSNIDLLSARSEQLQGLGLTSSDKSIQKQIAVMQQELSFKDALQQLQRLRETTNLSSSDFMKLKNNLEQINTIKLDSINQQFSDLSDVIKGIQGDFTSITKDFLMNTSSIGDSLKKLLSSVLNQFANLASQKLSDQLFGSILGGNKPSASSSGNNGFGSILSIFGGLFGGGGSGGNGDSFLGQGDMGNLYGLIPGFASGGMVGDIARTMSKERSISGYEPRLIIANSGERVLNPEETAIWNKIQSSGKLPNYADGGMIGGSPMPVMSNRSGGDVNLGGININIDGSGDNSNYDVLLLQKVLKSQIQSTLKQERRPGGSLNRGNPYNR